MMYVTLQVNRFQKIILLIVQYKWLKSFSNNFILQNLILHTRLCCTGFITQFSWLSDFLVTNMDSRKTFVLTVYQLQKASRLGRPLIFLHGLAVSADVLLCTSFPLLRCKAARGRRGGLNEFKATIRATIKIGLYFNCI